MRVRSVAGCAHDNVTLSGSEPSWNFDRDATDVAGQDNCKSEVSHTSSNDLRSYLKYPNARECNLTKLTLP
jgi:hypothetical protein